MTFRNFLLGAVSVTAIMSAGSAHAQSVTSAEIASMQKQIAKLEKQLNAVQTKAAMNAHAADMAVKAKPSSPFPDVTVTMPGNRPTICTGDGANCVALTGRLHYDVGGYSYSPASALTSPQDVQNGQNARRAQIGIAGKFARDWHYAMSIDAGGTTDGNVILHNAWVSYQGFKNAAIEGGYMNVAYTLDQSTSSNNTMFMERSSASVISTNIASGDYRSAFGARVFDDRWWAGAYVTGPSTSATNNHSIRPQIGSTYRFVGLPVHSKEASLLIGVDAQFLHDAGAASATVADQLRLSDRIEVRIDPATNALLSTGTMNNISGARVISGEAALNLGSFHAQGEYFDYNVQRFAQPDLQFNGGYIQGGYVLTGESRSYSKSGGVFGGIRPKKPVDLKAGHWGAWEIAARYTQVNLNDLDVLGGKMSNTTVGVNWYINDNMRMMFNWIHGDVAKNNVAGRDTGAKYDAFAMRTQFAF